MKSYCIPSLLNNTLYCVKARESFEKVGEATEAALITLVEKLNLSRIDKAELSKNQQCHVCCDEAAKGIKKVS